MRLHGLRMYKRSIVCGVSLGLALIVFFVSARVLQSQLKFSLQSQTMSLLQPRQFAAVAHDPVHRQFILFGGTNGSQRFDDTWVLGLSGWSVVSPVIHPAARISAAAAYDFKHNQTVLFGGRVKQALLPMCAPGGVPQRLRAEYFCGDTWVFDGRIWIPKLTFTAPSPREGHAMAYDQQQNQTVLFGGTAGGSAAPLNDTWIWDGNNWKLANPAHRPPARFWHTMAYDPVHRQVVLFGGTNGSQYLNDTWLWNGSDWQVAGYQGTPPELRTNAAMDYDITTSKMVLFSGSSWVTPRSGTIAQTSWSWDGTHWKLLPSGSFKLFTDFSKVPMVDLLNGLVANGTPTYLWVPTGK